MAHSVRSLPVSRRSAPPTLLVVTSEGGRRRGSEGERARLKSSAAIGSKEAACRVRRSWRRSGQYPRRARDETGQRYSTVYSTCDAWPKGAVTSGMEGSSRSPCVAAAAAAAAGHTLPSFREGTNLKLIRAAQCRRAPHSRPRGKGQGQHSNGDRPPPSILPVVLVCR